MVETKVNVAEVPKITRGEATGLALVENVDGRLVDFKTRIPYNPNADSEATFARQRIYRSHQRFIEKTAQIAAGIPDTNERYLKAHRAIVLKAQQDHKDSETSKLDLQRLLEVK